MRYSLQRENQGPRESVAKAYLAAVCGQGERAGFVKAVGLLANDREDFLVHTAFSTQSLKTNREQQRRKATQHRDTASCNIVVDFNEDALVDLASAMLAKQNDD